MKIAQRFAVENRLGSHKPSDVSQRSGAVGRRALLFKGEFAGNDFLKSNVGERSPRASLDHWPVPKTELTHALGYNVDKQLRVGNYLAGFLQELSRHNAQGVGGAGRLRRELENRRRAGRNGTREKTRAEHRDEKEMVNVGSKRALVKRFVSSVFRMCPSTRPVAAAEIERIGHGPTRSAPVESSRRHRWTTEA